MPPSKSRSGVESSELERRLSHWQHFKTGDFKQKWNSAKLIVREGDSAIAPLLELLNDPTVDSETHWFTIRALGHFPGPEVIAAIAEQIDNTTYYVNRTAEQATELSAFAIETLAAMGPVTITVLSQLLQNPQRRLLAAKALNQVRSSGVIPAMVSVVGDENANVRYYAIDALGSFHSSAVTPVLLSALGDPATAVRKAAVMALGRRHDLPARHQISQMLQPLLWDIDVSVCCQTALALGRLGDEDSLDALQRILMSIHTPVALRIDTVRALEWYCDRVAVATEQSTQRAFTILTYAFKTFATTEADDSELFTAQEKTQILVAIVRVLGDMGQVALSEKATHSLIEQLQSQPSDAVVQAVIMALARLGLPQAFDALLPLLKHTADAIPIHTIAALKRLDPDHCLERVSNYLEDSPEHQTGVLKLW